MVIRMPDDVCMTYLFLRIAGQVDMFKGYKEWEKVERFESDEADMGDKSERFFKSFTPKFVSAMHPQT